MDYMNIYKFILSILIVTASITSHAQRRNANGYKLVKSLSVRWHEQDGTIMEFLSSDYAFRYDEQGALTGLLRTFWDGKDTFTEDFQKDGRQITCTVLKNGKAIPKYSLEFGTSNKGKIEYRKEIYPVYDDIDGSIASIKMLVTWYRSRGVDMRSFWLTDEVGNAEKIKEYGEGNTELEERKWGLYRHYSVYLSKEGKIIEIDPSDTKENPLSSWDGDLYPRRITSDEDVRIMQRMTEYSDKVNDTNINFYGFSDQYINTPFRNAELLTEWSMYRSKHLKLKEGRWGKDKNGNDRYEKSWEYTYDGSNNITGIKIVDKASFNRYCTVTLEYLY